MPPTRDIMEDDPIATWRSCVGNNSAVIIYTPENPMVEPPLPTISKTESSHGNSDKEKKVKQSKWQH